MADHYRFYRLAEKRDRVLFENMKDLVKRKKAKLVVVVTGGFHAQGMTSALRRSGIPYLLITPKIQDLGAKNYYRDIMQGKASYMRYFKGSLWDAFARDYVKKGVRTSHIGDRTSLRNRTNYDIRSTNDDVRSTYDEVRLLKRWRDRILQNALAEGRITEAGNYTRYLDAWRPATSATGLDGEGPPSFEAVKAVVNRRFEIFSHGVQELWRERKITPEAIERLFEQMKNISFATLAPDLVLSRNPSHAYLLPQPALPRSELRAGTGEEEWAAKGLTEEEKAELSARLVKLHREMDERFEPLRRQAEDPALYTVTIREKKRFAAEFVKNFSRREQDFATQARIPENETSTRRREALEKAWKEAEQNIYLDMLARMPIGFHIEIVSEGGKKIKIWQDTAQFKDAGSERFVRRPGILSGCLRQVKAGLGE